MIIKFLHGLNNLRKWFLVIWNDRDDDYFFVYNILKFKLNLTLKELTKEPIDGYVYTNLRNKIKWIKTSIRLIDKLKNESYLDSTLDDFGIRSHDKAKRLLFKILDQYLETWPYY